MRIHKVLVLGGGSAGLIAAITLKRMIPALDVRVIRSKEIGVIGVGEGTTPGFLTHFHESLRIPHREFHERAKPTWKLGLRMLWGPRKEFHYTFAPGLTAFTPGLPRNNAYFCESDFIDANPDSALMKRNKIFPRDASGQPDIAFKDLAYHIENVSLVEYLEWRAGADGIALEDAKVVDVGRDGDRVTSLTLEDGRRVEADFYVDASGFRSQLLGRTLEEPFVDFSDTLFCDRAIAGPREREADEPIRPYTTVETMDHGWCWRIDHEHHVNRGYVYSSAFVSDEDAEQEFRRKNPAITSTRRVLFRSGTHRRTWVGNVCAIGNAAGFVEPLEATALGVLCAHSKNLAVCLWESALDPSPTVMKIYNDFALKEWCDIRDFLAVHYRFNTLLDTAFWRHCQESTPLHSAEPLLEFYRENGPSPLANNTIFKGLHQFGLEGYYSMFLGMKVPHERAHVATPDERICWDKAKADWVARARNGLTVREGLDVLRQPNIRWE